MATVLLIESDKVVASNLKSLLAAAGHQMHWEVELQSALDTVESTKPQAIILDLMLAGRSGAEFLHELRSYPDWEDLPVILYSSADAVSLDSLQHLNIVAYYPKNTTSLGELVVSLDHILQPVTK